MNTAFGRQGLFSAGTARAAQFEFRGNASEYFGIWIVNLLLTILTLGIYSAWAKVRRLRYFYGNTFLDGHNFEYHARPVSILIGRIIVVAVLVVYNILVNVSPAFAVLIIPYLIALPWLINKSLAFNARMTSYRNVRFGFRGSYWTALGIYALMPFAVMLTAGLLTPVYSRMSNNYLGNGTRYGTAEFRTDTTAGRFFGNFGMAVLFFVIVTAIAGLIGMAGFSGLSLVGDGGADADFDDPFLGFLASGAAIGLAFGVYAGIALAYIFYNAGARNIAFNATVLDGRHRLASTLSRGRYTWIIVSNLIVTLLTLTLMSAWASVRTWRYLSDHTALEVEGTLDGFVDAAMPKGAVAAAEFLDIEGIDFGL